jgi:chromosome segregation ATPase
MAGVSEQERDIEAVAFARREACRDVIAALEARVARFEAILSSPGWRALAAWFAQRPGNRIRELEAERDRLIGDVEELIAMNERMTGEGAELEAALTAAEARIEELEARPIIPPAVLRHQQDLEAENHRLRAALAAAEAGRDKANNDRGLLIQTQRSLTERAVAAEARAAALAEAVIRYFIEASDYHVHAGAEGFRVIEDARSRLEVARRAALGEHAGGGTGEGGQTS